MLSTTALYGRAAAKGRLDYRRAFLRRPRGLCVGHVGPEAQVGGPFALVRDGDMIAIDAVTGTIDVEVSEAELADAGRRGSRARRSTDRARSGSSPEPPARHSFGATHPGQAGGRTPRLRGHLSDAAAE